MSRSARCNYAVIVGGADPGASLGGIAPGSVPGDCVLGGGGFRGRLGRGDHHRAYHSSEKHFKRSENLGSTNACYVKQHSKSACRSVQLESTVSNTEGMSSLRWPGKIFRTNPQSSYFHFGGDCFFCSTCSAACRARIFSRTSFRCSVVSKLKI